MATAGRRNKIWYWKARKAWYVRINGNCIRLATDKDEAERQFHVLKAKALSEENQEVLRPEERAPVGFVVDQFLEFVKDNRAAGTFDWYQKYLNDRFWQYLKLKFKNHRELAVDDLRPFHLEAFLKTITAGSRNNAYRALSGCFNWAYRKGYTQSNPMLGVDRPPSGKRNSPVTRKEYDLLLILVDKADPFHDLIVFSWECGCRPQESLVFQSKHIDHDHKRIVMPNPKKGKRHRVIYMTEKAYKLARKSSSRHPDGPVFRNSKGEPWTPNSCSNRFDRLLGEIGRRIALYDFRHAFSDRMIEAGVDALVVATLMGHSDKTMLSKHYSHLDDNPEYLKKQLRRKS